MMQHVIFKVTVEMEIQETFLILTIYDVSLYTKKYPDIILYVYYSEVQEQDNEFRQPIGGA